MSPLEYVHTLRIEEAKQMLEAGSASVEAIAADVSRLFRRAVGLSPKEYRKRFRGLRQALQYSSSNVRAI